MLRLVSIERLINDNMVAVSYNFLGQYDCECGNGCTIKLHKIILFLNIFPSHTYFDLQQGYFSKTN